jgi:hypothetical protein
VKIEKYHSKEGWAIYRLEKRGFHQLGVTATPFESEWTPLEFPAFLEVHGRRFMSRNDGVQEIVPCPLVTDWKENRASNVRERS